MYSYLYTGIKISFTNEKRICNKYKHVTVINSKHYHMYNTTCNPHENKYKHSHTAVRTTLLNIVESAVKYRKPTSQP
jgi:hypothetical protein